MREDVIGRANVADTPELEAYYAELESLDAGALWQVANAIEPWEPKSRSVPIRWRYADLRDHVLRSLDLVTPEKAGRRVVYLANPGRRDVSAAVGWLYTGIQAMRAGETASAHRHAASALRFIMEGRGAYTIVDGHKLPLGANDFVLTPNGTWHEHGVEEDGETCIWQDGLDIPLVNALEANFYEVHPDLQQASNLPVDDMTAAWGGPGLLPQNESWGEKYSPCLAYRWEPTYETLSRFAEKSDGSPYDGIIMDYVNPVTGGPVMQTIGAQMQLLRPGERTKAHRQVGSFVYQVAKGEGYSIIGGQRFDWKERDIFVVPSWVWHEHANASHTDDACLFAFHDLPVMRSLGLYREEALAENDGHQPVLGVPPPTRNEPPEGLECASPPFACPRERCASARSRDPSSSTFSASASRPGRTSRGRCWTSSTSAPPPSPVSRRCWSALRRRCRSAPPSRRRTSPCSRRSRGRARTSSASASTTPSTWPRAPASSIRTRPCRSSPSSSPSRRPR
jgi:gentisate 1,2-dioxygenase